MNWGNRIMTALGVAAFQVILTWYFLFSFWAVIVLFLLLGGLVILLEHKNFGWGLIIGTILFAIGFSLFGWTIMPGWVKPY
jgi:hypothetical protein